VSLEVESDIRQFLTENFPLSGRGDALGSQESLIESGIIDSTGILELIEFIESRYVITIPDADVVPENLDTVDNITAYVLAHTARNGANGDG
jgi:acyl carrier protein